MNDASVAAADVGLIRRLLRFWLFAGGELFSDVGSSVATFTLDVLVYQHSKSVASLALVHVITTVPGFALAPLAGAWVDRANRRTVNMACNAGLALIAATLCACAVLGKLEPAVLFLAAPLVGALRVFQDVSFVATMAQLVPVNDAPRVHGVLMSATAIIGLVCPALASFLIVWIHPQGVLALDCASFLVALATSASIRLPDPSPAEPSEAEPSLRREVREGFQFVAERRGLLGLLLLSAVSAFALQMTVLLLTPLVLNLGSLSSLGTILSAGGLGGLAGGVLVGAHGGPRHDRMRVVLVCGGLSAIGVMIAGVTRAVWALAAVTFAVELVETIGGAMRRAIWQAKVPTEAFGRTLAVQQMAGYASVLAAMLSAGPLADGVFEPAMRDEGALASSLGRVLGTGPGRGIGALILLLGVLNAVAVTVAAVMRPVRRIEKELPDAAIAST